MARELVWIKCKAKKIKVLKRIIHTRVNIYDIKSDKKYTYLKIDINDIKLIKKIIPIYTVTLYKKTGINYLKDILVKHFNYFVSLTIGLIILFFVSNIIVKVDVIHSSKEIRNLVTTALEEEGIKNLSIKKDYEELENIKERILKKHSEDLEWLEIEVHGMKYIIRVEPRVILKEKDNIKYCHIVAKKSGIITDIVTYSGEAIKARGDYVSKGDIIISGNITYNESIKKSICASGIAKAEVWYTVDVSYPLKYYKTSYSNIRRNNLVYDNGLGKKPLFRDRLKDFVYKDVKLFNLFDIDFYKRTEIGVSKKSATYSEQEAFDKAILLAYSKINLKKSDKDQIITQKVLKKSINNSTINLEIFFAISEEIGTTREFNPEGEVE